MSLTCEQLIAFLDDYVDDRLPPAQVEVLERHLSRCASCVEYLGSYRETIRMLRTVATAPQVHPEDVPEELVQAILARREG